MCGGRGGLSCADAPAVDAARGDDAARHSARRRIAMLWIGWGVAVVAAGVAFWLWRQLVAERAHAGELLYAKIEAEDALEALRGEQTAQADANAALLAAAGRIEAPLAAVRLHLDGVGTQLADYRGRVRQFDAAVQYCLQPVEMIFGADKATLDELVHHVEGARRKLFEARTALVQCALHVDTDALERGLDALQVLSGHAATLATTTASAAGPADAADAGARAPHAAPAAL
jgi:hypothetical protein